MKRGGPLRRRGRLRQRNPERLARLRAAQFGAQAELCRALPCCVCGSKAPSDPAHVRSRGAGGLDSDCVPLCRACHDEQHRAGLATFQRRHQVDLASLAAQLAERVNTSDR